MSRLLELAREGDLLKLTDEWTDALLKSPPPGELLDALEILTAAGKTGDALQLAEIAAEELDSSGSGHTLEFVSGAARMFERSPALRRILVECLRDAFIVYEPLERFLEKSGLLNDARPLNASWSRMENLLRLQENSFLLHPTYGPGRIVRVTRSAFTVDFQRSRDHDMTLDAVVETTKPVEDHSIFVLAWRNPAALDQLLLSGGAPLLDRAMKDLASHGKLTRSGVSAALDGTGLDSGLVWKSLFTSVKNADGYILLGEEVFPRKGASTTERIRSLLSQRKPALSEKAKLVTSLLESAPGVPGEELKSLIPLICQGKCIEPGAAFELVWLLGGRAIPGEFTDLAEGLLETTASRVIRALSEMQGIPGRKAYLALYLSSSPGHDQLCELMDNLPRGLRLACRDILKDTDPSFLAGYLAASLSDPTRVETHMWALEQAAEAGDILPPDDITGQILSNMHRARSETQKRLCRILMNTLRPSFESHLAGLDTRRLERLAEDMDLLGSAHETGLLLVVRRQLSSRKLEGSSLRRHFWETSAIFSSPSAIGRMHDGIMKIQQKEIPAAAAAIAEAAAHGDLSENAEYKAAMERRDLLLDNLDRQRTMLSLLRPYPEQDVSDRVVSPGTSVTIEALDDSGDCRILGIVGPLDSDEEREWINYQAPLGAALLGRASGDTVTLPGDGRNWRVSAISVIREVFS